MSDHQPERPANYQRFQREVPQWYTDAKLGIFVHWGPYSVPAWAEPIGELGTFESHYWMAHCPYAEWYYNTSRIEGSPAQAHHQQVYGGADYDEFIDQWTAEKFDADAVLELFARSGARYFVPTTKHHDGVTLWDAPGTRGRNTVQRGAKRDLVGEFAQATRDHDMKFGVYYSGGLDWHFDQSPPITGDDGWTRPTDEAYARYAHAHVADLIERYTPDILWGDIEWPDAGKPDSDYSMADLFDRFYGAVPDGVANDRWGGTHWDFRTSEYQAGLDNEKDGAWEQCRGIGYSFGYNQLEDGSQYLSGPDAVRLFADIVARGGNLLLNVGLKGNGEVPELQAACLEHLGAWNQLNGAAIFGSRPLDPSIAALSTEPWARWTRTADTAWLIAEPGTVVLPEISEQLDVTTAALPDGTAVTATREGTTITVELPPTAVEGPTVVGFALRG